MSHKLTNEEIDEQFEQFLKESISDESVDLGSSTKSSVLSCLGQPKKKKEIKKDANLWWISDGDEGQPQPRKFSKLKKQAAVVDPGIETTREEIVEESDGNLLSENPGSQEGLLESNRSFLKSSKTSQPIAEVEEEHEKITLDKEGKRTSVSISKDSLEPNESIVASGPEQNTHGLGLDTLEEQEQKEQFFANLERGVSSTIDYSRLNQELEQTNTTPLSALNQKEHNVQQIRTSRRSSPDLKQLQNTTVMILKIIMVSRLKMKSLDQIMKPTLNIFWKRMNSFGALEEFLYGAECGMLAKVVLLDSQDSTLDTQKLLQFEEDKPANKIINDEKQAQQGISLQMSGTGISCVQTNTNSDMEALHQAYHNIDQLLEDTDLGHGTLLHENENSRDSILDSVDYFKGLSKNVSTAESDLPTVEELMKHINEKSAFARGFDSHTVSTNAQQGIEAVEMFRQQTLKDPSNTLLSEAQPDSYYSERENRAKELSQRSLGERTDGTKIIYPDKVDVNSKLYNSVTKHNLTPAVSSVICRDLQNSSKKPKTTQGSFKKMYNMKYPCVKSSGYGKVSPSKRESFSIGNKGIPVTPPKQPAIKMGTKGRSKSDITKDKPKEQLFATQTIRTGKSKFDRNYLEKQLIASAQLFTTCHEQQMSNSTLQHTELHHGQSKEQFSARDDLEVSKSLLQASSVTREILLLQRLEETYQRWNTEHNLVEKLKAELELKEQELLRKDQEVQQLPQLKEQMYILQTKLNTLETSKKKWEFGEAMEPVTEEKLKLIEKDIQEQETLIQGYHQENEKLYKRVKELQLLNKVNKEKMSAENQLLMAEVGRLKEQLNKSNQQQLAVQDVHLPDQIRNQNFTEMLSQLRITQKEGVKFMEELKKLKQEKQALEVDLEQMKKERDMAKAHVSYISGDKEFEMKMMQEQNKQEIHRLNKRLQWYAENQEMLDKDTARLKAANVNIEALKEQVEKLRTETRDKSDPLPKRAKERGLEAKRIQDLERQVKEMEEIIRRRYPNSLPALIYAAASVSGADCKSSSEYSVAFLEKRIKKLESDLEGKDEEAKTSLRAMEQQFQKIKIQYEMRISELEQFLAQKLAHERENPCVPDPKMKLLEEEIHKLKEIHKSKENRLRSDIEMLKNQLYHAELKLMEREDKSLRTNDQHIHDQAKIEKLNLELASKNREIQELSKTLERLQRERRMLLHGVTLSDKCETRPKSAKKSKKDKESNKFTTDFKEPFPATLDEKIYRPNDFAGSHISEVLQENEMLKSKLERFSLEMDQQRAKLQSAAAQAESEVRRTRESASEHVAALKASHQRELERILTQHALEHSSTKVAEMLNKISTQEVMLKHLREQVNELQQDREALSVSRHREESLQTQVTKLLVELREAKESHTPEMRHFVALERKIKKMELKHAQREQEFQEIIQQARLNADTEQLQEVEKWKKLAQLKNQELENFRAELDSILDVLRELQRQGVVIPAPSSTRTNLSTFPRQL
ncbi:centrosomal protein of 162 kDa [Callorhinchus milii]|uniref:centrosomal protein of 162 kDa n=1 Tax=Callorhinchus milii TaxID=7868 RepID=UPI001C3F9C6B|nr:centrosomal protein of 162 kDa [Callorhinchus milii]